MATTELHVQLRHTTEPATDENPMCDSCPHPVALHDQVGRRYCEATQRMALTRHCICRGDTVDVEQDPASAHRFP
ncbi:MAG TPA: RGCVC family protein [Jatrophihabitantaceae bacterium]|jgi:hypothetical protein